MQRTACMKGKQGGFTLLELMVVVVLIGIMTAMIIPEMKGSLQDALLRSTARKLVAVFNIASSQAATTSQLHRVQIDRKKSRCFVERTAREGEEKNGFVPLKDIPGGEGNLDARVTIEVRKLGEEPTAGPNEQQERPTAKEDESNIPNTEAIAFYPDGTADAREIILKDREGFRLALRINPTTGRVLIVEQERE